MLPSCYLSTVMEVYWMSPRARASTSHSAAVWSWPGAEQSSPHTGNPHPGHPVWRPLQILWKLSGMFVLFVDSSDSTTADVTYLASSAEAV